MGESDTKSNGEVKLEELDVLKLQLVSEKQRRLQAEADRLRAEAQRIDLEKAQAERESAEYVVRLGQKYGVDFNEYAIFPDQLIAKKRQTQA